MEIHHGKHHQTYINNLNNALEGHDNLFPDIEDLISDISSLPDSIQGAVRNNGGMQSLIFLGILRHQVEDYQEVHYLMLYLRLLEILKT